MLPNSERHDINVRLALGSTLCGLGHDCLVKILDVLNLPPPVQEHKYRATQEFLLAYVEKAKDNSLAAAAETAVDEGDVRDMTMSDDGAWLTRAHSSVHGIAALCRATKRPKVVDTNWSSEKFAKYQ
ncbi:unnamed protein product [Adineta ricciae]|uniref:Mutator-like transposase domain-containing protein n=1 Tax=Adineta ricciae TaxID=249248 RepID=A0A815RVZ2_ADIRI|nr:unnamed protein product [Adineta ricciae]